MLALALVAAALPVAAEGSAYQLHLHGFGDWDGEAAQELLDVVRPVARELLGMDGDEAPDRVREVHLYATKKGYLEVEGELTGGTFADNLSLSHWDTQSSHVALQPQLSPTTLGALGLPYQTARLLVHEAAHLAVYEALPNYRSHPFWFSEGVTQVVEERVLLEAGWIDSREADPFFSESLAAVQDLLAERELPRLSELLTGEAPELASSDAYGFAWLAVSYLADEHGKSFGEVVDLVRRTGGGEGFTQRLGKSIEKELGAGKLRKLDKGFERHLEKLEPAWRELYRSLETKGDGWAQTAFRDRNAVAWRTEPAGDGSFEIRGELRVLPGGKRQLNVLLGRDGKDFHSVAIVAGYGVTVFEFVADRKESWKRLGSREWNELSLREDTAFSVLVERGELTVTVGDDPPFVVDIGKADLSGPWGLGAQAGTAGVWTGVECVGGKKGRKARGSSRR